MLLNTAYSDWVSQLWEDATDYVNTNYLTQELQAWIIEKLIDETS